MTSISDHGGTAPSAADTSATMPRSVRIGLTLALAGLMTGALYLALVRGEALLLDLAALGHGLWCF